MSCDTRHLCSSECVCVRETETKTEEITYLTSFTLDAAANARTNSTNVKLIPGERIEQQWRFSNWEDGLFSNVKISISESDRGNTRVSLVHSGVPDEDKHGNSNVYEQTERGWRENIFHRIRTTFGYGV